MTNISSLFWLLVLFATWVVVGALSRAVRAVNLRRKIERASLAGRGGQWDKAAFCLKEAFQSVRGTRGKLGERLSAICSQETLRIGGEAARLGEFEFAMQWYPLLAVTAKEHGLARLAATAQLEFATTVLHRCGRNAEAYEIYRSISEEHEGDDELFIHALFGLLQEATRASRYDEASDLVTLINKELPRRMASFPKGEMHPMNVALKMMAHTVDFRLGKKGRELSPQELCEMEELERAGGKMGQFVASMLTCFHEMACNETEKALTRARKLVTLATEIGESGFVGNAYSILVEALFRAGRFDEIINEARTLPPHPNPNVMGNRWGFLARALARREREAESMAAYSESCRLFKEANSVWKIAVLSTEVAGDLALFAPERALELLFDASLALDGVLRGNPSLETMSRAMEMFGDLQVVAMEIGIARPALLSRTIPWIEQRRVTTLALVHENQPRDPPSTSSEAAG